MLCWTLNPIIHVDMHTRISGERVKLVKLHDRIFLSYPPPSLSVYQLCIARDGHICLTRTEGAVAGGQWRVFSSIITRMYVFNLLNPLTLTAHIGWQIECMNGFQWIFKRILNRLNNLWFLLKNSGLKDLIFSCHLLHHWPTNFREEHTPPLCSNLAQTWKIDICQLHYPV